MFKVVLKKAEEAEIKLSTSAGSSKKQESSRSIYFCFIDYSKAFDCVDHNKLENFISNPKRGNAKECSNYHTIALISHASKVMLKLLQAKIQQYVNRELSDV